MRSMQSSRGSLLGTCLRVSAVALLGLSTGCAEPGWQRAGTDAATVGRDLEDCRRHARAYSARFAWPFPGSGTRLVTTDRAGRPLITPYPYRTWLENDRSVLESELIGNCMRDNGFMLAPAKARARE